MSQPFPLDTTIGDGRLVLVEWLAGSPEQGVYLAASVPQSPPGPPMPPYYLVSTALEPDGFDAFQTRLTADLLIPVPGVAPLFAIMPFDVAAASTSARTTVGISGVRAIPNPALIGMIESCPSGVRSHEWPLPVPSGIAARFALQVAFSMEVAHAHGIGIGGIRPEHVFINQMEDSAHVSGIAPRAEMFWQMLPRPDFSIAPAYHTLYDAPEQLSRSYDGVPTPASDVFALCATLAFWLTGKHPFVGDTLDEQISAIRSGQRAAPPAAPGELLRGPLLRRGLNADPVVRPTITNVINVLQQFAPDVRPVWEAHVA